LIIETLPSAKQNCAPPLWLLPKTKSLFSIFFVVPSVSTNFPALLTGVLIR
jgi:hypothetical protein